MKSRIWLMALVVAVALTTSAIAQEMSEEEQYQQWMAFLNSIDWVDAGGIGEMGEQGEMRVPSGYMFTGPQGTKNLMQAFGNLLTDQEVGFVAPSVSPEQPDFPWFAVFEFDKVGYVKDDEKADLDANEMMEDMLKGQEHANEQREKMGYDTLHIAGWAMEPRYNERTNHLEWAINLSTGRGEKNVNLNTRLLGREGVMKVTLVCDPEDLQATIPEYQDMLRSFSFQDGHRYAEFRKGDKLAKYGLTGLVVGGGAAVLAKTGILQKLLKPLLIGLVAVGAWLKRFFTGRSS